MTIPDTAKLKGATNKLDRVVTIGEELYLVVEARVVAITLDDVTLEALDAYELGRYNDLGDKVLEVERRAWLGREDDRKGRSRLPFGESLAEQQAALANLVDDLDIDEDTGVARLADEGPDAEYEVPAGPDDPDFVEPDDFDPGDEPFPETTTPAKTGPSVDETIAAAHFAAEDTADANEVDPDEDRITLYPGPGHHGTARIPARLLGHLGPAVDRCGPKDVLAGTVDDIKARLTYVEDRDVLAAIEEAERDGKSRKGVLENIGKRSAELSIEDPVDAPALPVDVALEVPEGEPEVDE